MFGAGVDTLNIYIDQYDSIDSTNFTRTLIWKKTGSQGKTLFFYYYF
jgi:hypothetical protein